MGPATVQIKRYRLLATASMRIPRVSAAMLRRVSVSMLYILKTAHVVLAVVSAAGFGLRVLWIALGQSRRLHWRWVRIAPHCVDTALLAAGVAVAVGYSLSPLEHPWFAVKLLLLVAYVLSGAATIRRARGGVATGPWPLVALACLALIFITALSHRPLGLPMTPG